MALIKCPECGREISDKATACIHCGFPMELINKQPQIKEAVKVEDVKEADSLNGSGYSLELLDYGSKKIQVAVTLKNALAMKDSEALELVSTAPCYLFEGKKEKIIGPLLKKLDSLPIEYNLYLDGELKKHKTKEEIEIETKETVASATNTYTKKIKCPKCSAMIAETSRSCSECGFDGIGSYLLQLERERQSKVIDYTHDYEVKNLHTSYVPKCPTCGSPKIQKVSTLSKAGSVFVWGLFSQKVKHTWHCNNCGSEW